MEDGAKERLLLIVENNAKHADLIAEVLQGDLQQHQVKVVQDGVEAMRFLHRSGEYRGSPRPDLILLDLNLPGKDGREVLAEIKADPQLKRIPIVVLTTSAKEEDIFKSYKLQGNCYVLKSQDLSQLLAIVKRIEEFWLGIVTLPLE